MATNPALIAAELRRQSDTVLVRTGNSGSPTRLHLVGSDGESVCERYEHEHCSDPVEKPIDAYPPGYASWCVRCARIETGNDDLEGPIVHPVARDHDGGVA